MKTIEANIWYKAKIVFNFLGANIEKICFLKAETVEQVNRQRFKLLNCYVVYTVNGCYVIKTIFLMFNEKTLLKL